MRKKRTRKKHFVHSYDTPPARRIQKEYSWICRLGRVTKKHRLAVVVGVVVSAGAVGASVVVAVSPATAAGVVGAGAKD